jgi:PadR family transcriptional regulator, regulatory protein PadR
MVGISRIEQHILLAVLRLQPSAHGGLIQNEIKQRRGPEYSFSSIYVALVRLEAKGLLVSTLGRPISKRGGRRKLFFRLTAPGQAALAQSLCTLDAMRHGTRCQGAFA